MNELMSNTPLNPLSRGGLKVSLRDAVLNIDSRLRGNDRTLLGMTEIVTVFIMRG